MKRLNIADAAKRTALLFGAVVILAAFVTILAGCPSATPKKETKEPQDPVVEPTLFGTWTNTEGYYKDHEHVGTTTRTLTFTASRWIQHAVARLDDGTIDDHWNEQGGWSVSGDTITKIFHDDEERQEVEKQFNLTESDLFVHDWDSNDSEINFDRYSRVDFQVTLSDFLGVWKEEPVMFEEDGEEITHRFTYTISGVSFHHELIQEDASGGFTFEFSGKLDIDHENLYLLVTVESASVTNALTGETVTATNQVGTTHRYGFAPAGIPGAIIVSDWFQERRFDEDTQMWVDKAEENPFGNYSRLFERVSQ